MAAKVKKVLGTQFQLRTESATVPITFTTKDELEIYRKRMKKEHPFFHSILKAYKVTITQTEECLDDDET